jgi:hypothetical protein
MPAAKAGQVDASPILFDDLRSMDDQEARAWDVSSGLIVAGLALVDFGPAQRFHSEPDRCCRSWTSHPASWPPLCATVTLIVTLIADDRCLSSLTI